VPVILEKAVIFARMKPNDKADLVDLYEEENVTVYCGDGANDCGALKHASVGVSLSKLEASVASPFTSNMDSISCVPSMIKEGRCALITSISTFKYMALYAFIQFISILMIYWRGSILSDAEYLYIDLIIIDVIVLTASRTEASETISKQAPPKRIFHLPTMVSIIIHIIIVAGFQAGTYAWIISQPWFCSVRYESYLTSNFRST